MKLPRLLRHPFSRSRILRHLARDDVNFRGMTFCPPGSYHSPLLDIKQIEANPTAHDNAAMWENVDLQEASQRVFYENALSKEPPQFPHRKAEGHRYFSDNIWFRIGDAFTLREVLSNEKPRRVIEVGSGFSSALMLDTFDEQSSWATTTFIEPNPDRLQKLLTPHDRSRVTLIQKAVQDLDPMIFQTLERGDVLFIDSSHVAKVGSDVTFLLLRVLPRLKSGVIIHIHDIFYPYSYPFEWIAEGRAWNETLFLRAFLIGNSDFEVTAFNAFAGVAFAEMFRVSFPQFLTDSGGSIWLRKRC